MFSMRKSEIGDNSATYSQNFTKSYSGNLHLGHNLCVKYHDPSRSSSPDILLTRLLYYTKCQSRKWEIIQSNIYRILPKVNQVIYTLNTIYEANIMILAQAVLQIFCRQGSIGLQWQRKEKTSKKGA